MPTIVHEEVLIFEVPKIKDKTRYHKNYQDHSENQNQKTWPYYHEKHDELLKQNDDTMIDNIFLKHDDIKAYQSLSLEGNVNKTVCQNGFCCDFKIEIAKIDSRTKYRLVVFSGIRHYSDVEGRISVCGLIQCSNDSISSCGSVQESEMVFSNIEIVTTLHDYKNKLIMPSTLNSDLFPLKDWIFDKHTHDDHVHVHMFLNKNTSNVITFAIYTRDFNKNNANITSFYIINYFVVLLATLFSRL